MRTWLCVLALQLCWVGADAGLAVSQAASRPGAGQQAAAPPPAAASSSPGVPNPGIRPGATPPGIATRASPERRRCREQAAQLRLFGLRRHKFLQRCRIARRRETTPR